MRNLIVFLWKYHFFILFLLFEVFSIFLIFENSNFHRANMVNSANNVAGSILKTVLGVREYIHLKETNDALAIENAELRSKLPTAFYGDSLKKIPVYDSLLIQKYVFFAAKVINNSTNKRNNYLTIDKGSKQGLKPEMGVVNSDGVVGIVKDVSEYYSTVISLLHKDTKISVKLKKNDYFGSLVWDGGSPAEGNLQYIPKHVVLVKGDTIVTSSFSRIFPEGVFCGIVTEFELNPGDNFYTAKIKLAVDFSSITQVYLVDNLMKEEQIKLEETTENAN
jgi:rod shape-determining protein MreC